MKGELPQNRWPSSARPVKVISNSFVNGPVSIEAEFAAIALLFHHTVNLFSNSASVQLHYSDNLSIRCRYGDIHRQLEANSADDIHRSSRSRHPPLASRSTSFCSV